MRLLILGDKGFIGSKFIEIFHNKYEIITAGRDSDGINRDFTCYNSVLSILSDNKPDAVLNLAGKSYHTTQDNGDIYESNALIQLNLHEAVNYLSIYPKIVFCSSSAVYESSLESVDERSYCRPVNTYAKAKYIQERIALSYYPGQQVSIARLFNVIGPHQSKKYFIPAVIERFIQYQRGEIAKVKLKTLNAIRDFIYIDDVCSGISAILDKGDSGEIYNVCSSSGISINEVIELLQELLEIPTLLLDVQDDHVKEGINYQVGDNQKLLQLGWAPSYNIKESLKTIIGEEYGK